MIASLIELIKQIYLKYIPIGRFFSILNREIKSLKGDIRSLKGDIRSLKGDIRSLKVSNLENENLAELNYLLSNIKLDFSFIDFNHSCINKFKFIQIVYNNEIAHNADTVYQVVSYQQKGNEAEMLERDNPSDIKHLVSNNYKKMLMRYFYAGAVFCKNKNILDSCCGEGWGTFILSSYAETVTAFDQDISSINIDKWSRSNINWIEGDALDTNLLENNHFDVVSAMETIEHFTREDGKLYFKNMHRLIKDNGIFIGSSFFPDTRERAESSLSFTENPFHLYIWTVDEITKELEKYFSTVKMIDNWMFIAKK
jgi:2-polyprenyl-3-methyl-5-hydroxy-6-metoxy-1,4-benzoquinol methylase